MAGTTLQRASGLLWILPCLPAAGLIYKYGVNIPVFDQWDFSGELFRDYPARFDWAANYRVHGESRMIFPSLIWWILARLTGWNMRWEMFVGLAIYCLSLVNLLALLKRTTRLGPWETSVVSLSISFWFMNPLQAVNWVRGDTLAYPLVIAFALLVLRVCVSSLSFPITLVLGAIFSTLATLSFLNGFLCWLVAPGFFCFTEGRRSLRAKWRSLALYFAAALLCGYAYFRGYGHPYQDRLTDGLHEPLWVLECFLAVLGLPFAGASSWVVADLVGAASLLVFLNGARVSTRKRKETACWVVLGSFSAITCLAVANARAQRDGGTLLQYRYALYAIPILVSGVVLHLICFPRRAVALGLLGALSATNFFIALPDSADFASRHAADLRAARAALHFIKFFEENELLLATNHRSHHGDWLIGRVDRLNRFGLISPALAQSDEITGSSRVAAGGRCAGFFDGIDELAPGKYFAYGWATAPLEVRPADAILLAEDKPGGVSRVFAVAKSGPAGWSKIVEYQGPKARISAWAYDSDTGLVTRLCSKSASAPDRQ